ncbi:MAG: hypothetical protein ABIT38_14820, partial [Gemmatimonadaceae bacterium]
MSRSLARVGVLCFAVACSASHSDSAPRDTSVVVAPSHPLNGNASVNTLLARADSLFLPDNSGAGVL